MTAQNEGAGARTEPERVDVQQLMAEIRAEVDWKRRAGLYPPEVLEELDVSLGAFDKDSLDAAIQLLRRSASFSPLVSTASRKGPAAPLAAGFKKAVRSSTGWYMSAVLQQVELFARRATRVIGLLADRLTRIHDELEQAIADRAAETRVAVDRLTRTVESLPSADEMPTWRERLALVERSVRDIDVSPRPDTGGGQSPRDRGFGTDLAIDYIEFENHFRGTEEQIRAKQLAYIDLFQAVPGPVVDLGCGRGEFLELLSTRSIDSYGIDRYPGMVELCRGKGLDAREGDVLEYLSSVEAGSLGGIFCSQMIEHLDVRDVPSFFESAARALGSGGRLVVETINPASLIVFSQAFYLDLGHLRPLHPLTLSYLAEKAGFAEVELRYSSYPPADTRPVRLEQTGDPAVDAVVDRLNENFRRLDDAIFGPQDFAVIGKR